jgi:hypothetical protein
MSRLENAPSKIEIGRLMAAMVDQFCDSYQRTPSSITLDIDDTFDAVHGQQQLSLFNAHYDERCFLPIHIYEGTTGKPVATILREGKTPSGKEVRTVLKHVIKRIRSHWPNVAILVRGDNYSATKRWNGKNHDVDYVRLCRRRRFHVLTREAADAICVQRASARTMPASRLFNIARGLARAATCGPHRGDAQGLMSVMSSPRSAGARICETLYCARGNAENLIKLHKCRPFRSHVARSRANSSTDPSHRRPLASDRCAPPPRRARVALRRVQHPAPSSDQDRRARGGRRGSHPCLLAHRLSRPRCLPRTRRTALRRRAIANAAPPTPHRNFQPSKIKPSRRVISLRRDRRATPLAQNSAAGRAKLLFWVNKKG